LRSVWNACKDDDLGRIIKLLVLTGCRRTEIGELRWSEIDLVEGKITLPEAPAVNVDARTKNGHAHEVPLSPMAMEIIRSIPQRVDRDFVFGFTGQGFRQWKLKAELEDGIAPWRLHDIRRTLTTEMAEHDIAEPHIVEAITNHRTGDKSGIRGVYNRAKYKQQMKTALNVWADHVASIVSGKARKVLPFTG
jgi:integrase